jgi:quercetin dioxygenase-like cupin family protein
MSIRSIIGAICATLAITTAIPAAAHDPGDVVTPHFQRAIPNIPGKTLTALIVDYPPGGASASHTHPDSAFIFAYVISGEIESKVNDGPTQVFRAGESWYEPPAASHPISRNASKTEPAKLLAIFVADTDETALTTPVK